VSTKRTQRYQILSDQSLVVVCLPHFPKQFYSIKAVEYVGRDLSCTSIPVKDVQIVIYVYKMCSSPKHSEEDDTLVHGEIIELPSLRFEGIWDRHVTTIPNAGAPIERS
jgi:hypothetical protein